MAITADDWDETAGTRVQMVFDKGTHENLRSNAISAAGSLKGVKGLLYTPIQGRASMVD